MAARGERRAQNGGELAAAEGRGDAQRIVEDAGMAGERAVDHVALPREAPIVDAGAAAGPALAAAAKQRGRDRRCRGRVADAHFAEADESLAGGHRVIAGGKRRRGIRLRSCRRSGEIGGRGFEVERDDAQTCTCGASELIDGGAAGGEIRHHLGGDGGRIRRHALGASRRDCRRTPAPRCDRAAADAVPCHMGEPGDDLLEPAEAVRRLRERVVAHGDGGAAAGWPLRQVAADARAVRRRRRRRAWVVFPMGLPGL